MPITPTEPTIVIPEVPAQPAKVADTFWLQHLEIEAMTMTTPVMVVARLIPYDSASGTMFPQKAVTLQLQDVLTLAATDVSLANTINVIFNEVDRQAKAQGLI